MRLKVILALGALTVAFAAAGQSWAQTPQTANGASPPAPEPAAASKPSEPVPAAQPETAEAQALRKVLSNLPAGNNDEERNERAALLSFYEKRNYAPLWVTPAGTLTAQGSKVAAEIKRADDWGLDPRDFPLPAFAATQETASAAPDAMAASETAISLAVLKYGRFARGGRIIFPAEQLSSYLDRRPQLVKPSEILDGIAEAPQPDAYLSGLNPQNPQFAKLREKYLVLLHGNRRQSAETKRLLANMEEWRWMPVDMGELYIWNNIPDFTQRVVKDGKIIREVRIVAGEVDKETPIFSHPLRKVVFKPTWIVPDSVKVHELWPSLLRGGRMMREYKLEVETKDGRPVDWRKIDWSTADIRKFEVIQPNGPMSVMGKFKFSFPNQHTVFMHDTLDRDRWMFRKSQRTYSHGCMRVANPVGLAEIVLREDKGWEPTRVLTMLNSGPRNNEIPIDHRIMIHMTYFTVLAGEDGKLHTFPDVYGHERRITLALEGKWDRIVKGRNHLAPVELNLANAPRRHPADDEAGDLPAWQHQSRYSSDDFFSRFDSN